MKIAAYRTQLRYTDPDDNTLKRVHWVADINGPSVTVETIDVTTHDSPDGFSEFAPGMADGAEVTFDLIFDAGPAGHQRLLELMNDRPVIQWKLLLPRPEVQTLLNPDFTSGINWTAAGAWSITGGKAGVTVTTPTGTDILSQNLPAMTDGDIYRLEVIFAAEGTGTIEVSFDGTPVGELDPAGKAKQVIEFVPQQSEGDLALTVTAGPASASIESIKLFSSDVPTQGCFVFDGLLTAVGVTAPVKDALKASVTIKISGEPAYAPLEI